MSKTQSKKMPAFNKRAHSKAIIKTNDGIDIANIRPHITNFLSSDKTKRYKLINLVLIPLLFYFIFLCIFAWPWISHFNTHFFTDKGDGFQNVWNMWWVNYSITHLHQSPWHTNYLHYPYGTTLIAQTLNPFNGFIAIGLLKLFSLVQAFNIMVIFSFIFSGLTAFWLSFYLTRRYIPSLLGGFIFTFSSYHFAHAIGHMQLVSFEWMPLFILLWWELLIKPRLKIAIGGVLVLLMVLLCDYYYFMYCVVAGFIIFIYLWKNNRSANIKQRKNYLPWIVFLILGAAILSPLPLALLSENNHDPLQGAHNDRIFSTDLFSTVIEGAFWKFHSLTYAYWHHIKAFTAESSISLTLSASLLTVIAIIKRKKIHKDVSLWVFLGAFFAILSLGPRLIIRGYSINHAPMPYALLENIIPQLKLSGDPDRMIVITTLAVAVLSAITLTRLKFDNRFHRILLISFFVVFCLEVWPYKLPLTHATAPGYVYALKNLPYGGVVDNGAISPSWALYDQTIYQKPEAFGYISRTPTSVADKDNILTITILRDQFSSLCPKFAIRYITTPAFRPLNTNFPIIYNDHKTLIYDLKDSPSC